MTLPMTELIPPQQPVAHRVDMNILADLESIAATLERLNEDLNMQKPDVGSLEGRRVTYKSPQKARAIEEIAQKKDRLMQLYNEKLKGYEGDPAVRGQIEKTLRLTNVMQEKIEGRWPA